jgi:hypothetical protein
MTADEITALREATLANMIAAIDRALERPWPAAGEGFKNVFMSV